MPAEAARGNLSGALSRRRRLRLERFVQADVLELRSRGEGFRDVAPIERAAEAHVRRALRGHERMFAHVSSHGIGA
jgi:hypothetical protein